MKTVDYIHNFGRNLQVNKDYAVGLGPTYILISAIRIIGSRSITLLHDFDNEEHVT